jgi:hypothetical protein
MGSEDISIEPLILRQTPVKVVTAVLNSVSVFPFTN